MCRPFSLILTKNQTIYSHPNPLKHSHTEIMDHFKIKESKTDPRFNQFVRIEISPVDEDYQSNPDNWKIKVDEDYTPSWYEDDRDSYEAIIRKETKSWLNRVKEYFSKITDPEEAYDYCNILNAPIKELELIIASDAECSCRYALFILKGRFKLGEKIIATIPWHSYSYAMNVLKGRFKLGEKVIADSEYSYLYARYVLRGRFKLGEPAIATHVEYSYDYAVYNLKDRFKLGEKAIATDSVYSYHYAKNVLKGRFKLGEKAISKNEIYRERYEEHFNIKLKK